MHLPNLVFPSIREECMSICSGPCHLISRLCNPRTHQTRISPPPPPPPRPRKVTAWAQAMALLNGNDQCARFPVHRLGPCCSTGINLPDVLPHSCPRPRSQRPHGFQASSFITLIEPLHRNLRLRLKMAKTRKSRRQSKTKRPVALNSGASPEQDESANPTEQNPSPSVPRSSSGYRMSSSHLAHAVEVLATHAAPAVRETTPSPADASSPFHVTGSATSPTTQKHPAPPSESTADGILTPSSTPSPSPPKSPTTTQIDALVSSVRTLKQDVYDLFETKKADMRALAESKRDLQARVAQGKTVGSEDDRGIPAPPGTAGDEGMLARSADADLDAEHDAQRHDARNHRVGDGEVAQQQALFASPGIVPPELDIDTPMPDAPSQTPSQLASEDTPKPSPDHSHSNPHASASLQVRPIPSSFPPTSLPPTPLTPTFASAFSQRSYASSNTTTVTAQDDEDEGDDDDDEQPWILPPVRERVSTHGNEAIRRLGRSVLFALFED